VGVDPAQQRQTPKKANTLRSTVIPAAPAIE
jgi:hypothetical protein